MSHRPARIALPICLLLAAAPGCSKKGSKTRVSHEALAKVPPVKPEPLPIPKTSPHADQLGHFIIDDVVGFWKGVNQIVSKPGESKMPDLRTLLTLQLPDSQIPTRLLLDKPMGCVVYDPTQYMAEKSWPGVCFFSYQGGAKAFIEDLSKNLGKDKKPLDPKGHGFHTLIQDKHVFVDELDNAVILSGETSRFAASTDYIKSNIFNRKIKGAGLSFDLYVAEIYKRYEPLIKSQMKSLTESDGASLALMGTDKARTAKSLQNVIDILSESEHFHFSLVADQHRYTVSSTQRITKDAPTWKKFVSQDIKKPLTTDLIARMPKELSMLGATRLTPPDNEWKTENVLIRWRSFAKMLEQDEAWAKAMLQREQNIYKNLGGQLAAGTFATAQGPGALISMVQAAPGVSLQDKWRSELETLPTTELGEPIKRHVDITFTPKATTIEGVVLDEIKVTPKPAALQKLKTSLGEKNFNEIQTWLGNMSLVIHLGQVEHIAFAVATSHDAKAASAKAVAALHGKDNFVLHPEFSEVAKKFAGNSAAFIADSGALSRALQSAQQGDKNGAQEARNGFVDSQFFSRVDPDQGSAMTGSISAPLIPLLIQVAKRSWGQGTLAR